MTNVNHVLKVVPTNVILNLFQDLLPVSNYNAVRDN